MHSVTLEEAAARLPELIAEVGQGGEVVITQHDKPVARLAPAPTEDGSPETAHASLIGFLKGKITLKEGWDDPLEEMQPYTK